jgi:replicative DNA helicase
MAKIEGRELVFHSDPLNEQVLLAAALLSVDVRKEAVGRHPPDVFLTDEHRSLWSAIREAVHRGLECDPATLAKLSDGAVDVGFVAELLQQRPAVPDLKTLSYHVEQLLWDRQRHVALTGPIAGLLEAIQKSEGPERVRALARQVGGTFDGWGDRRYLHDPEELVREQIEDVRRRGAGRATYPTGVRGLDFFGLDGAQRRIIPGFAPGLVTVVTGTPGSGKSTCTARFCLEQARMRRKVLVGAWEMKGGTTLELIACMSLTAKDPSELGDWSRTKLTTPADYPGWLTEQRVGVLEQRMRDLSRYVRFLANPFRRSSGEKTSNERNLDLVHGYISDSGAEVFVADLWKRCLAKAAPEDEEEALYRQQAMAEELGVHCILVQQQRLKDIELRPDKRPTREGIKGSGAWTEIADNIFGIHRPALWKSVPDNVLEIDVLKQRYGRWPLAVEFDWDPDRGMISGGIPVEYEQPGRGESTNPIDRFVREPSKKGGKGRHDG